MCDFIVAKFIGRLIAARSQNIGVPRRERATGPAAPGYGAAIVAPFVLAVHAVFAPFLARSAALDRVSIGLSIQNYSSTSFFQQFALLSLRTTGLADQRSVS